MEMDIPEIDGEWPDLAGKALQGLIAQECWYGKTLEEEANVVLIKVDGRWFHLYFDMGIIFWRTSSDEPHESKLADRVGYSYHLKDLGKELGLEGRLVEGMTARPVPGGVAVELSFEGGKRICFKNVDNLTGYDVGGEDRTL